MLLTSLLLATPLPVSLAQLEQLQQDSLAQAYEVEFADADTARKAAISLHGQLLDGDWRSRRLVLQLDPADQARLAPHALSIKAATQWQQQQRQLQQERMATVTAAGQIPGFACYPTLDQTYSDAAQLAAQYPSLASWDKIGSGWAKTQGRPGDDLYALKISDSTKGPAQKPKLLIYSAIHAREYATAALTLAFAKDLLSKAGQDADVDWMLAQHEVHLVLHANPEGRRIAETGVLWRKNINDSACANQSFGVDLNRNFSFSWFSIPNGSSGNSCAETYRGPAKASEPEVQALESYTRALFADRRGPGPFDAAPADTAGIQLDIHSFSELVLWPWGETAQAAPNAAALKTLGYKLAWFNGYLPTQSIGLYPTDGTSDGVGYGELGVASFTFELGKAFFEPCASYQARVLPDNLRALYYALRVSSAPYLLPAGPDWAQLRLNTDANGRIAANQLLQIKAQVTDAQASNHDGGLASQPIRSADVWLNQPPDSGIMPPQPLTATDGSFDSAQEEVQTTLDISKLGTGRHTLYFRATDSTGQHGPLYARYFEVTAPVALPKPSFEVHCHFLRCQFVNTTAAVTGIQPSFRWQFTQADSSTAANAEFSFPAPGLYQPALHISLGELSDSSSLSLQVYAEPVLTISSNCQALSCTLQAQASSANGAINTVQWQVNGQSYSGTSISVSFAQAGQYPVQATVIDSAGQQRSQTLTLTVTAPVTPPPPANTSQGGAGGGAAGWLWGFLLAAWWRRR